MFVFGFGTVLSSASAALASGPQSGTVRSSASSLDDVEILRIRRLFLHFDGGLGVVLVSFVTVDSMAFTISSMSLDDSSVEINSFDLKFLLRPMVAAVDKRVVQL